MTKVMVFGVFDGLHEGHRAMFQEARTYGQYLIAVVTPDEVVRALKGHRPKQDIVHRIANLKNEDAVDEVAVGDSNLGSWEVVKKYQPEVIACGYDQKDLKKNLEKNLSKLGVSPKIIILKSFLPDKYKSSLLNDGKSSRAHPALGGGSRGI